MIFIGKCKCWFCGGKLIWGADFSYEDYGMEGEGIVATLTCSNCGAFYEAYSEGIDIHEDTKNDGK